MKLIATSKSLLIDHHEEEHMFAVWEHDGKYYGIEHNDNDHPQKTIVEYGSVEDFLLGVAWGNDFYEKIKDGIKCEELKKKIESWLPNSERGDWAEIHWQSMDMPGGPEETLIVQHLSKEGVCQICNKPLKYIDYGWSVIARCEKHGTIVILFIKPEPGEEMKYFPHIEVRCPERLKEAISLARDRNQLYNLMECFQLREMVAKNDENGRCILTEDIAPYSFAFVHTRNDERYYNGGIIYHGNHDGHGSGSAPTYSVTMDKADGWRCHT